MFALDDSSAAKAVRLTVLVLLILLLSACASVNYYRQAAWGQWRLLQQARPVLQIVADENTPARLRDRLQLSQQLLAFAEEALLLEADGRYRRYAQLQSDAVVWNLFAAEPFSVEGRTWCYPVVGCAPYRGYFNEAMAQTTASRLRDQGLEVFVGGVPAYSTLGWFDDPLLSTFVAWPEAEFAELLLHELAHGKLWVSSDVTFNESFASFVAEVGLREWYLRKGSLADWHAWREQQRGRRNFQQLLVRLKRALAGFYARDLALADRIAGKQALFSAARECYARHRQLMGEGRFDTTMANQLNNAFLVSVATYNDWVPGFELLYGQAGEDWRRFYERAERLASSSQAERDAFLQTAIGSAEQHEGGDADDEHADEIDCEAFPGHGLNTEMSG